MDSPWLLDLFCGAGGAGEGYRRAGFHVVSCDIAPQPRNPHEFYRGDALAVLDTLLAGDEWQGYHLWDFAAIHASPPCQEDSVTVYFRKIHGVIKQRARLILPVYERLRRCGLAWVIENVDGAPMPDAIELCGSMFGLPIRRHRLFASSHLLFAAGPCKHMAGCYNVVGGKVRGYGAYATGKAYKSADGVKRIRESYPPKAVGQAAMGIGWMTVPEMSEAIPPAYTEWLGKQLMRYVREEAA